MSTLARDSIASPASEIHDTGLWIGKRRRGGRYTAYPNGEIRRVDRDFDRSVFDDPESLPSDQMTATQTEGEAMELEGSDLDGATDQLEILARAMLKASPTSLVTIYHDRGGNLLGAIVTPAKRGLTAAVFRKAFRSLPSRAKQVTFATHGSVPRDVRDSATMAADMFLVRIRDLIRV